MKKVIVVKGIISIAPVSKQRESGAIKTISIESRADKFSIFANKIFWPFQSIKRSTGNSERVLLENIRHDQFKPNLKIFDDETLLEFIEGRICKLLL